MFIYLKLDFILVNSFCLIAPEAKKAKYTELQVSIEKVKSYGYSTSHLEKGKVYQ